MSSKTKEREASYAPTERMSIGLYCNNLQQMCSVGRPRPNSGGQQPAAEEAQRQQPIADRLIGRGRPTLQFRYAAAHLFGLTFSYFAITLSRTQKLLIT